MLYKNLIFVITTIFIGTLWSCNNSKVDEKQIINLWFDEDISNFVESSKEEIEKTIGAKVKLEVIDHASLKDVIQVNLSSGSGPDGFNLMSGIGFAGPLVQANLIAPLDKYYEKYNWDERFLDWAVEQQVQNGHKYGLPGKLDIIGVFYYKSILNDLGLKVPNTYEELQQVSAKLKDNGYIPLAFANQGKWPAYHAFSMYANNIAGIGHLGEILAGERAWTDPDIVTAIQDAFIDMVPYYPDGTNGIAYGDGNLLFYSKRAAMLPTGSWLIGEILKNVNDNSDVGFFALPAPKGKSTHPPSGIGDALYISAASDIQDKVANVLDIVSQSSTADFWINERGLIPSFKIDNPLSFFPTQSGPRFDAYNVLFSGNYQVGFNIDVLTPQHFNQTMSDGFQAVIAKEKSAKEMAEELQNAWENAK